MKEGIHPNYKPTTIKCACGEVIETSSTKQDIRVDIAPSAIRSLPASKSLLIQADASTASRSVTIWTKRANN